MMMSQKLVAFGAGSVIVLAASAQVLLPPCCKYLWEWPSEDNPDGACTGSATTSCQTGSQNVWGEDPMSRQKGPYVDAQCFSVVLYGTAQFARQDCSEPEPAHSKFIGVLPNGQCCYAIGDAFYWDMDIDIEQYNAGYLIKQCEDGCDEFES